MRSVQHKAATNTMDRQQKDLDQLIGRSLREHERRRWKFLYESRSTADSGRPDPTDEAIRIWYMELDKTNCTLRLLCGKCPNTRARPTVGRVHWTKYGLLLAGIYNGPNLKGTEASGSTRRFRMGQWLSDPPQTFVARCGRCGSLYVDVTGDLVAEVRVEVGAGEKNLVVDPRYLYRTT
jgi:hypothetical protein